MRRNNSMLEGCFILILPVMCLSAWAAVLFFAQPIAPVSEKEIQMKTATGTLAHFDTCDRMKRNKATGHLCIDLCVEQSIKLPKNTYLIDRYYLYRMFDSLQQRLNVYTIACSPSYSSLNINEIMHTIDLVQFELILVEKIKVYLSHFYKLDDKLKY